MHTSTRVITAAATREGTGGLSGDAYAVHRLPGTDTIAAAVVDGIGHDTEVAEWLRYNANGGPIEQLAACHDSWVRGTLALASFATVHQAETIAPLVILTSDGVHDQIERADLERLVVEHADEPQALADALVAAAEPGENGRRDDATAVVIKHA